MAKRSPHVFQGMRLGMDGLSPSWRGSTVSSTRCFQFKVENLGWVACRRKRDVSAFGGQPHGELRGRPITDLTSDDPAVYTELVACCLIQLTPRHTNTRLNIIVLRSMHTRTRIARVGPSSVERSTMPRRISLSLSSRGWIIGSSPIRFIGI